MSTVAWRNDRVLTLGSLTAIITLSWLYLARAHRPHAGDFLAACLLWTVMMVAMMLPTAVPAIDLFGTFARKRMTVIGRAAPTSWFVLGYIAVWTAVSLIAAAGQAALSPAVRHAPTLSTPLLDAALLLLAGAFQFSSVKNACLTQCRSPVPFFLANWRDGTLGAFVLGARHGSYCLGCCLALMGLMFVFGAMNLLWMGALSLLMLSEKIAPASWRLGRRVGILCLLGSAFLIVQAIR